jgi:hypothetical protein
VTESTLRVLRDTAFTPTPPLDRTIATFRKWLYLPDPAPLLVTLGAVAANVRDGDPVWLLLVGPPGGGKSELLQSLIGLPDIHPTATLTEAALLSGTPKREHDANAKGGLLRAIGNFGIILCKAIRARLNALDDRLGQESATAAEAE